MRTAGRSWNFWYCLNHLSNIQPPKVEFTAGSSPAIPQAFSGHAMHIASLWMLDGLLSQDGFPVCIMPPTPPLWPHSSLPPASPFISLAQNFKLQSNETVVPGCELLCPHGGAVCCTTRCQPHIFWPRFGHILILYKTQNGVNRAAEG